MQCPERQHTDWGSAPLDLPSTTSLMKICRARSLGCESRGWGDSMKVSIDEYGRLQKAAIRTQSTLFELRLESNAHRELIRNSAMPASQPDEQFISLLQKVFSHHELTTFSRINRNDVDLNSQVHITKLFHQKYFSETRLARGTSSTNAPLSIDQFAIRISKYD